MSSTSAVTAAHDGAGRRIPTIDRIARAGLIRSLERISAGSVTLCDSEGITTFGRARDPDQVTNELSAVVSVRNPRFFRRAALGGSLAAADSYLDGDWSCDDLTSLFQIVLRNPQAFQAMDQGAMAKIGGIVTRVLHWLRRNTERGSRRNIEAHYDLGNEFFRLFLDETMMYSSGIFISPESTLYEASVEKLDRTCRRLALHPGDHVLEIGTGWGGFALHAAMNFGCRVTTTTISRAQFEFARERVRNAGLESRISVLCEDYRNLTGRFDKLVSIEMIEAVGHRFFDTFFRQCGRLLAPDGLLLLQGIVINERTYPKYLKSVDFIQKYVFPGGCLPSVGALNQSAARTTALRLLHMEDLAWHYAQTLRSWRDRFCAAIHEVRALGYSERFIRLWNYYLCYCEAAFEERWTGVVQMLWAGPESRHDLILAPADVAPPGVPG